MLPLHSRGVKSFASEFAHFLQRSATFNHINSNAINGKYGCGMAKSSGYLGGPLAVVSASNKKLRKLHSSGKNNAQKLYSQV